MSCLVSRYFTPLKINIAKNHCLFVLLKLKVKSRCLQYENYSVVF